LYHSLDFGLEIPPLDLVCIGCWLVCIDVDKDCEGGNLGKGSDGRTCIEGTEGDKEEGGDIGGEIDGTVVDYGTKAVGSK